jgi:hypothetical protein
MPLIYGEGRKNALARLEEQIEKSSKDPLLSLDEEQRRMLIDSLRFDQIDARQMTIKNAHAKTCRWLLKKSEYLDWLDTDRLREHNGFLWIRGKPGTGKSTLIKFVLAHARKTMAGKAVISFFFNARGEDVEKSTIGTYRSLLLQLVERFPAVQRVFNSLGLSRSSIGLVLEGQEGHSQDITNYLESELKIGKSKIAQQIRSELQEKASGVFMWLVLVVGILNIEHDRGRVHALGQKLQEIPGDLHDLFRDILTRDTHNKDELVLGIQWVLFAKHSLSLEQLYFAILSGVELEAVSE